MLAVLFTVYSASLAFGGVTPAAEFGIETAAFILLIAWILKWIDRPFAIGHFSLMVPVVLGITLVAGQFYFGITEYGAASHQQLLMLISYFLLMALALQSMARRGNLQLFAAIQAWSAGAIGLFAIVQDLTSGGKIYWVVTPTQAGQVFGSYVNHNHFAGFMEMLVPFPALMACQSHRPVWQRWAFGASAVIGLMALLLSRSRGGMIALTFEMVLGVVLLARYRTRRRASLTVASLLIVSVALILYSGAAPFLARLHDTNDPYRMPIYRDTVKMIASKPWIGHGAGTFPTSFPRYQTFYLEQFVNHAHNDYLELLADNGILGFACLLGFLAVVVKAGVHIQRKVEFDEEGSAALLGIAAILAHSFVDFNMYIPANALMFLLLCATVVAAQNQKHLVADGPRLVRRRRSAMTAL